MNEKDMNTLLERDNVLREAVNRREQKLPSMPSDLNARLMQRMEQKDEQPKRRIWLYVVSAVAASVLLLLTFHFWQKMTEETPQSVVAEQNPPKKEIIVKKLVEVEQKTVAMVEEPKMVQEVVPRKQRVAKVVKKQEVEEEVGVQELPVDPVEEELMAMTQEPAYEPVIEDPYAYVMNQMRDIRSRGERLQQEVAMVAK
ncbi:MAG: hypothetical protein J5790_10840 [Bacteroidaceae bacterium]|nr:hypothetical protein [Bacteroidaceae bacterium]